MSDEVKDTPITAGDILCLQGRQLCSKDIAEFSQRTGAMAVLYGCQKMIRPCTTVKTVDTMPMTLFPSTIPRDVIDDAIELQKHFNTMIRKVAHDHQFLHECMKDIIEVDDFIGNLWKIYEDVRKVQDDKTLGLAIVRNDFMLEPIDLDHISDAPFPHCAGRYNIGDQLQLKQVEFNGIAVATGGMLTHIRDCHRYALSLAGVEYEEFQLPVNRPIDGIADGLLGAWELYGNGSAVILFVAQDVPLYLNPDQRWVERRLFEKNCSVGVIYSTYTLMKEQLRLKADKTLYVSGREVAVVYYRMGYDGSHFKDDGEYEVRRKLEISRAIKCPPLQYFFAQSKKVQEVISREGCVERFVDDPAAAERIRKTFVRQYSLDSDIMGDQAVQMAMKSPERFVLKSQTEGGGNKFFCNNGITTHLEKIKDAKLGCCYTLMERIRPVYQHNVFIKPDNDCRVYPTTDELGIYGVILGSSTEELVNNSPGYSLKSKRAYDDEGGLSSGNGFVDSLFISN